MKRKRGIIVLLVVIVMAAFFTGCGPKTDSAAGKYVLEEEHMAIFTKNDFEGYYYNLDSKGGGEYVHKGSTHKVKYTYNAKTGEIYISDKNTGINYNGTLINGELHIYDGNPESFTVSEFWFIRE